MKFDDMRCLIREKYLDGEPGNFGDSLAETARHSILTGQPMPTEAFVTSTGFLRHRLSPWREDDTSADQVLPAILAFKLQGINFGPMAWPIIKGTRTISPPGLWFAALEWWSSLNAVNIAQGWILQSPIHIGDDFSRIESKEEQAKAYLNMICIWVFLKRIGKWSTLPRPKDECIEAVIQYYQKGHDAEPNSQWIVDLYEKALKE